MAAITPSSMLGQSTHFATLPTEVRVMIYKHLFNGVSMLTEPLSTEKEVDPQRDSKITNIFQVNQQCYAEASPIFYEHTIFTMRHVMGVHYGSVERPRSFWTGPTTTRIRNLVITQSKLSSSGSSLGQSFPSLKHLQIEVFRSSRTTTSLLPPAKLKVRMATAVFSIYEDMCRREIQTVKSPSFKRFLFDICDNPNSQWMLKFLTQRIDHGVDKDQYMMSLKIDLTDAIPWIDEEYADARARFQGAGSTIVGIYIPDDQMWGFIANGKQIMVPELLDDSR